MTKVLLGFMGVGKSTVSKELDQNYRDMDAIIEERVGMPIASFLISMVKQLFETLRVKFWQTCYLNQMIL